jgi:4-carboxymuconolactone decarboxylase
VSSFARAYEKPRRTAASGAPGGALRNAWTPVLKIAMVVQQRRCHLRWSTIMELQRFPSRSAFRADRPPPSCEMHEGRRRPPVEDRVSCDLRDASAAVAGLNEHGAGSAADRSRTACSVMDARVISSDVSDGEGCVSVDYTDRLRSLGFNDVRFADTSRRPVNLGPDVLDPKTLELVRLAALVAVGGAVPSYGAQADSAVSAGATVAEIVDVLVGVIPIVGLPCVVAAAPKLALALGYDLDDAVEHQPAQ